MGMTGNLSRNVMVTVLTSLLWGVWGRIGESATVYHPSVSKGLRILRTFRLATWV